jgi:glyoxylase-like metal-dependent hydrolase (beta-lactamase superfamily II)/8-oxo-dGTP pyrophosphatase MutT (NUDIX family)
LTKEIAHVTAIAEAASVLLASGPGSPSVFIVRRAPSLRFFGGFLAFPGGRVGETDTQLPNVANPAATEPENVLAVRRVAAARELFEETGVLIARKADGSFPADGADLISARRELTAGHASFPQILGRMGLTVHAVDFTPIGSVTTPAYAPLRFDTTFFVAQLPAGQRAEVWHGELDEGHWTAARQLLESWTRGECLVSPPALIMLEAIRDCAVAEAPGRCAPLLRAHNEGSLPTIYFSPAVQMIPLRTTALAPSSYTNAYLIGTNPAYLLDPGAVEAEEQQRLFELLDARRQAGVRLTAVVLSHQHPDHIGAAGVCARRYGLPIWAHPLTARALEGRVEIERELHEGQCLDLGTAPDGSGPWHLEALHTPGHAAGHLAFYEAHYRLLFVGDMVSTLSSIVIAPPEGDLAVYLNSLERLRGYDCRLLLPAHGNPSARPGQTIAECLEHRARREVQLRAALASGPHGVDDLTAEIYRGLPEGLMRFARLQVLAGLYKLERERQVQRAEGVSGEEWVLRPSPAG